MNVLGKKFTRAIAVSVLAIGSMALGAPASTAIPPSPAIYPSVPYRDVPVASITGGGWTQCWTDLYGDVEPLTNLTSACTGSYILLAGGPVGGPNYTVAAAGERASVFGVTAIDSTALNNGTYWYFNSSSMGFSPLPEIRQTTADIIDSSNDGLSHDGTDGQWRMSWHRGSTTISGGWRAGLVTWLNSSTSYVRVAYQADVVTAGSWAGGTPYAPPPPPQPQLVVDAVNVNIAMGEAMPTPYRVLGLVDTDTVTDVVLEYEGMNQWGEHYGPSTTAPTLAGTYTVTVKSYKLTAANAAVYWQTKHSAELVIRWAPVPITDAALASSGAGTSAGGTNAYKGTSATATGADWNVTVAGGRVAVGGGYLLVEPGTTLTVSGTGFRKLTGVRIFLNAGGTELGTVYTDANGAFSKKVTISSSSAGDYTLQVNGYAPAGGVRTASFAIKADVPHSISKTARFNTGSSELKASIERRIQEMTAIVPTSPWIVTVLVTGSATDNGAASMKLANDRVNAVAERLRAVLAAAGLKVDVQTAVWVDPDLTKLQLRTVSIDVLW